MPINKVVYGNSTLIDITDTTAIASDVALGKTFYGADGRKKTGTSSGGGYTIDDVVGLQFNETGNIVLNTADRIAPYAFYGNKNITSIDAPNVQFFGLVRGGIGESICDGCSNLVSINFPNLTNPGSGGYQFHGCTNLTTVHFPKAISGQHMFDGCTKLETAVLLGGGALNGYGFSKCTRLLVVDVDTTRVHTQEFANASKFATLIVRYTAGVPTLSNINAFTNTCFASGKTGGTLYVPQALISSYQSATNWSTILGYANNQILPIEGSVYENYYADGTPIAAEE